MKYNYIKLQTLYLFNCFLLKDSSYIFDLFINFINLLLRTESSDRRVSINHEKICTHDTQFKSEPTTSTCQKSYLTSSPATVIFFLTTHETHITYLDLCSCKRKNAAVSVIS